MLLATTADLVLAGIQDIQQTLLNLSPGLHLPPSHVTAFKQLTNMFMSCNITNNNVPVLPQSHESLRVETSKPTVVASLEADHPPLRVVPPATVPLASSDFTPYKAHFAPTS
jgi:hypothetical protein